MATIKEYLDITGLQQYDALIKECIPDPDEETITLNEDGELKVKARPIIQGSVLIF